MWKQRKYCQRERSLPRTLENLPTITIIMKCIILILITLFCVFVLPVSAIESKPTDTPFPWKADQPALEDITPVNRDIISLISLLQEFGIDISYGEEGDIFSMVDESLTRIIASLASGNVEGFMDIPLIRETLDYFGLSADEIVFSPNESPGRMEAIEAYTRKYGSRTGV
ncbi:MAG TPA: hypothetical protein PK024_07680 [Methanospirillum sp.]|uniref:hypothetical protein n=1 Tax=Methanospirillum sp. TaxID=45200 RepID=UPI002C78D2D3|nr:hypothetical protein [Methanospirillum sp.]HOJ96695.1 hypothetical protein [Methanospirillum sp.]